MTSDMVNEDSADSYALNLANSSFQWYRTAAIRSRKAYRLAEAALLVVTAGIPVAAAISLHNAIIPAILGSIAVVLSGLRVIFHWQENYLRFSIVREAVESERRLYRIGAKPYDDLSSRDQSLVISISQIERDEIANWSRTASERVKS